MAGAGPKPGPMSHPHPEPAPRKVALLEIVSYCIFENCLEVVLMTQLHFGGVSPKQGSNTSRGGESTEA